MKTSHNLNHLDKNSFSLHTTSMDPREPNAHDAYSTRQGLLYSVHSWHWLLQYFAFRTAVASAAKYTHISPSLDELERVSGSSNLSRVGFLTHIYFFFLGATFSQYL